MKHSIIITRNRNGKLVIEGNDDSIKAILNSIRYGDFRSTTNIDTVAHDTQIVTDLDRVPVEFEELEEDDGNLQNYH